LFQALAKTTLGKVFGTVDGTQGKLAAELRLLPKYGQFGHNQACDQQKSCREELAQRTP
jgi:hypothetical protein